MSDIDEELKGLAALALRNAFWEDFSALVNKYLEASAGLDIAEQEAQMGELTSIYGRSTDADPSDVFLNIWSQDEGGVHNTTGHFALLDALEHAPAEEIYVQGHRVFVRRNGEWYFTGD